MLNIAIFQANKILVRHFFSDEKAESKWYLKIWFYLTIKITNGRKPNTYCSNVWT